MSRLDSFIRRLSAQRDCLNHAARLVAAVPGPVLELGLGNGRTYDHLCRRLPKREIFVFDRRVAALVGAVPDSEHIILGEFRDTLPGALARIGAPAALVHGDFGSADDAADRALAAWLGAALPPLLAPGAIVVTDQPVPPVPPVPKVAWQPVALPDGLQPGRYFISRVV